MDEPERTSEKAWIERCQRGDKEAYGLLVRRYMQQAYFVALGLVGNHDDALDLSQEAFVRAYRAIKSFDSGLRFYTWYYRILKNLCLNALRDRRTRPATFSTFVEYEQMVQLPANTPSPDARLMQEENRRRVWDALWLLDVDDRELIVARDMLGTSYKQLAELMECPIGTVMSRLYYARRRLRQHLEKTE